MISKIDKERALTTAALVVVTISTIFDLYDDYLQGATWLELCFDLLVSGFVVFTLLYIWALRPRVKLEENKQLLHLMRNSDKDLALWKSKASRLLQGLGAQIDEQFDLWGLSVAEREVAILLIKGVSFKEIATLRSRSEKTVRQQASSIYAKSNLENRVLLSAFFLEDLLLPAQLSSMQ